MRVEIMARDREELLKKQVNLVYGYLVKNKETIYVKILQYMIRMSTDSMFLVDSGIMDDMAKMLGVTRNAMSLYIKEMIKKGILRRAGAKKKGAYVFCDELRALTQFPAAIEFVHKPVNKIEG